MEVVLKVYHDVDKAPDVAQHEMYREVAIQSGLHHPNIVHLFGAFEEGDTLVLVQEYVPNGDLLGLMQRHGGRIDEPTVVRVVMRQLLGGLVHLHRWGIVHRDVKPENVLFAEDGTIKLADFGLAIDMREERPVSRVGTLDYMAPEVLHCPIKQSMAMAPGPNTPAKYGYATDVWAVGIVTYELLTGLPPYAADCRYQAESRICAALPPLFPHYVSPMARDFILRLLAPNPADRPTMRQLLEHPWIVDPDACVAAAAPRPYRGHLVSMQQQLAPSAPQQQQQQPQPGMPLSYDGSLAGLHHLTGYGPCHGLSTPTDTYNSQPQAQPHPQPQPYSHPHPPAQPQPHAQSPAAAARLPYVAAAAGTPPATQPHDVTYQNDQRSTAKAGAHVQQKPLQGPGSSQGHAPSPLPAAAAAAARPCASARECGHADGSPAAAGPGSAPGSDSGSPVAGILDLHHPHPHMHRLQDLSNMPVEQIAGMIQKLQHAMHLALGRQQQQQGPLQELPIPQGTTCDNGRGPGGAAGASLAGVVHMGVDARQHATSCQDMPATGHVSATSGACLQTSCSSPQVPPPQQQAQAPHQSWSPSLQWSSLPLPRPTVGGASPASTSTSASPAPLSPPSAPAAFGCTTPSSRSPPLVRAGSSAGTVGLPHVLASPIGSPSSSAPASLFGHHHACPTLSTAPSHTGCWGAAGAPPAASSALWPPHSGYPSEPLSPPAFVAAGSGSGQAGSPPGLPLPLPLPVPLGMMGGRSSGGGMPEGDGLVYVSIGSSRKTAGVVAKCEMGVLDSARNMSMWMS